MWLFLLPALAAGEVTVATLAPQIVQMPVVEGQGQRFSRLSTDEGLPQTRVAQIVQDDQGFVWMGTPYGLNRCDGYDFGVFVQDARSPDSIGAVFVTALFHDRDNGIWVGGAQTLDRLDPASETVEHIFLRDGTAGAEIPTVVHISQDRAGAIWLSRGAGLFRRDHPVPA